MKSEVKRGVILSVITLIAAAVIFFSLVFVLASPSDNVGICKSYTEEKGSYFKEIVFGSEYGSQNNRIVKFPSDIGIAVLGNPSLKDFDNLDKVIGDLNKLMDSSKLFFVDDAQDADIRIYFVDTDELGYYIPTYVPGNWGFFWYTYNSNYELNQATIGISIDDPTQKEKNHLVREELTQSLGMAQDSCLYEESIFYCLWQGETSPQKYSDTDEYIIKTLYSYEVESGMTKEDIDAIFATC